MCPSILRPLYFMNEKFKTKKYFSFEETILTKWKYQMCNRLLGFDLKIVKK
jgi:hypothetical protein